jgi:hypothetical protein
MKYLLQDTPNQMTDNDRKNLEIIQMPEVINILEVTQFMLNWFHLPFMKESLEHITVGSYSKYLQQLLGNIDKLETATDLYRTAN